MKRMMEVSHDDTNITVNINSSSLELINSCLRKSHYILDKKLVKEDESEALTFGKSIHKALEIYYSEPIENRKNTITTALHSFEASMLPIISKTEGTKRSRANGIHILEEYFKIYGDDNWIVHTDKVGPLIERDFQFKLGTDTIGNKTITINYFGTVDAVMRNTQNDELWVWDHKTTSTMGGSFIDKVKPNHQYTGYIMGATKAWGLKVNGLVQNGIGVFKTKTDFIRVNTRRNTNDFIEFAQSVFGAVRQFLFANTLGYPLAGGNTCHMFAGCQFRDICAALPEQREEMIKSYKGELNA